MKANIILILRILLGGVFIFSGIAKLDSIYQFEQDIFKAGVTNWELIPYLSRFIIAAEIFLGICFFHKEGLKKFTIPATFLMLVIFTIHLGYAIMMQGGLTGNCGCFGNKISMTPLESLIKNIVMLGVLIYLYKTPIEKPAREIAIPVSISVFTLLFVWLFFPVKPYVTASSESVAPIVSIDTTSTQQTNEGLEKDSAITPTKIEEAAKPVKEILKSTTTTPVTKVLEVKEPIAQEGPVLMPKATSKYAPFKNFSDGKALDLDAGIKIVTMYNTGCDHCMENAKKMGELNKKVKLPEARILFWGNEPEIPAFFEFAKWNQPYKFLEPQVFFPLLGKGNFPKIILLNNGNVVGEWEGDDSAEKLAAALKEIKWN